MWILERSHISKRLVTLILDEVFDSLLRQKHCIASSAVEGLAWNMVGAEDE